MHRLVPESVLSVSSIDSDCSECGGPCSEGKLVGCRRPYVAAVDGERAEQRVVSGVRIGVIHTDLTP